VIYLVSDRNKIIKFSVKNACNFFGEIFSFKITTILHKIIEYDICYLEELNHLTPLNIKRVFRGIGIIFWCNYIKMEHTMAGIKYLPKRINQSITDWKERSIKEYIEQYIKDNSLEENEKILLDDEITQFENYIEQELGNDNSIVFDNENVNNYLNGDAHKNKLPVIKLKIKYIENRRNALIKDIKKNKSIFTKIEDGEFERAKNFTETRFSKPPPMSQNGVEDLVEQVNNNDNYKDVSNIFFMKRLIDIYFQRGTTTVDMINFINKRTGSEKTKITTGWDKRLYDQFGNSYRPIGPIVGGKRYRSTKRRSKRRSKRKQKRTQKRRASRRR
jgi:hypothetical protein